VKCKRIICTIPLFTLAISQPARADLFGGDVVVLSQILIQSIQTVLQLRTILATGTDTLDLLRDVNSGIRTGLDTIRIINPKFNPGVYGNLSDTDSVLAAVQNIYGTVPHGMDENLMTAQDQSVAETISMNRNLYDYADDVDRERDRIIYHAAVVSPQGAGKLQGQALGVLIGVSTQILRTQSQLLKLTAQNMAMQNRREKLSTESFQQNYDGLSKGFSQLPEKVDLPRMGGAN
jgi:hypothetical protein